MKCLLLALVLVSSLANAGERETDLKSAEICADVNKFDNLSDVAHEQGNEFMAEIYSRKAQNLDQKAAKLNGREGFDDFCGLENR